MAVALAILEGGVLFTAVSAMSFLWGRPSTLDWLDVAAVLGQAVTLAFCCIVAFYYNDLYDLRIVRNFGAFTVRLLQAFGVAFIFLAVFYSIFPESRIAEGPFVSGLLLIVGCILPLRAFSYGVMRSRPFVTRVLILGTSPLAMKLIEEIEAQPHQRYAVVGIVDDSAPNGMRYPVLGPLAELGKHIEEVRPDRVVVALAERRGHLPVDQLLEARMLGTVVEDGVQLYERLAGKLAIESLTPSNLIFSRHFRNSAFDLAVARALSLTVAILGLLIFAPLFLLIALAIKLDSRGPVFFRQGRAGLYGRPFTLIKFRTMHSSSGPTSEWVIDNTSRITRMGKWLRKFRLDEIPQFVNILRGDMNLVGPRPHPISNCASFRERIPHYALRSSIRPGVTGWAQVRYGYANGLEEETEKMRHDLYYIKHWCFWFDLRILFDTVKIVLFGRGAQVPDAYGAGGRPGEAIKRLLSYKSWPQAPG